MVVHTLIPALEDQRQMELRKLEARLHSEPLSEPPPKRYNFKKV